VSVRLGVIADIRDVPFDVEAVVADLRRRRHPQTEFVTSVLAGSLGAGYAVEPVGEEGALGGGERGEVGEGGARTPWHTRS